MIFSGDIEEAAARQKRTLSFKPQASSCKNKLEHCGLLLTRSLGLAACGCFRDFAVKALKSSRNIVDRL